MIYNYYYYEICYDEDDGTEYYWDEDYENVEKCQLLKGYRWVDYDEDGVPY